MTRETDSNPPLPSRERVGVRVIINSINYPLAPTLSRKRERETGVGIRL